MKCFYRIIIFCVLICLFGHGADVRMEACTTAVVKGEASATGGPMLWKNRDTSFLSNKVIYVEEKPFSYIGIVNAAETSGLYVYAGLNSEGFGIMNSVAYNLPKDDKELKDLEGRIMADALRSCRTAGDFETYLKKNLGESLGSWANFGVIDAQGAAVLFEVHNHGYKKYDVAETPEKYLINSNFSRSGKPGKGDGYLRFERAAHLFKGLEGKKVSHEFILQTVTRDFGHPLLNQPALEELKGLPGGKPLWVYNRDCINRPYTASAVVMTGKSKRRPKGPATLWVILGEPLTSIAVPLWVEAKTTPPELYKGDDAPLYAQSARIQKLIRPYSEKDRNNYMNVSRLVNKENTGFLPGLLKVEKEILTETAKFLEKPHSQKEYADFQSKMVKKALEALQKVK